jgi:D-aminopeptidase
LQHKKILIIADIEGSSGCFDYPCASFMGRGWPRACLEMSLDINAIVVALFAAGIQQVYVKDFHRTGYNLLPQYIDPRAILMQGYSKGPVPGIGNPPDATGIFMVGMHAPSGAKGFLPHTLTSRISRLMVNGRLMTEAQLFSASLAPFGMAPLFFSGCPVACDYAAAAIQGISCVAIDKFNGARPFDAISWRRELAFQAVKTIEKPGYRVYNPPGPFHAVVTLRDGKKAARTIAVRWKLLQKGADLHLYALTLQKLYGVLIKLAYLTPFTQKALPLGLPLYNMIGRMGRFWAEKQPPLSNKKGRKNR